MVKVLVAISSLSESAELLHWLRGFRSQFPCEMALLHVIPVPNLGEQGIQDEMVAQETASTKASFERLAGEFEIRVRVGEPGPVICREAKPFDLVVVGSQQRSAISEALLGSTSNYVSHHAPCDVWIHRNPKAKRPQSGNGP